MAQIEVTIETAFLASGEPSGRYRVRVAADATVETLLRQLCKEASTPCKADYSLQSKETISLCRTDILSEIGIYDGAFLMWTSEVIESKGSCHCNTFWFMAAIAFLIGVAGIVGICIIKYKVKQIITDYAIVFDAGSSHTAMFIYKWEGSKFNGTALAQQSGESCRSPGGAISSYASKPSAVGGSLKYCLGKAKSHIPHHKHSKTPIYLGATAGMRLLRASNATVSEDILENIRTTFKHSAFQLKNPKTMVRIIDGSEEGTFSWITSNYVTNSFKVLKYLPENDKIRPLVIVPTVGALDLGGASTQISFIPANSTGMPKAFSQTTDLFNHNYTLYTHSYLCYGQNEANRRSLAALVKEKGTQDEIFHPCLPNGYNVTKTHAEIFDSPCVSGKLGLEAFGSIISPPTENAVNKTYFFVGESFPSECSDLVTTSLFNMTAPCPYSRCSFNGVYQPPVNGPFYAFSSFYYLMDFLNLTTPAKDFFTYDEFLYSLNVICMKNWSQIKVIPDKPSFLPLYCEQGNYVHVLLTQGYGFTDKNWQNIHFVKKIFTTEIGWTLGFVLDKSLAYPVDKPEKTMYNLTFYLLLVLFVLFLLVSVGFIIHGFREKKSQSVKYQSLGSYGAI